MKYLKSIFVALLLTIGILSVSNPVYADENDTYDSVMYWGINDGTLYLSPAAQGYAMNEDIRDLQVKDLTSLFVDLFCDWYEYADSVQKVEILPNEDIKIKPHAMSFWFYDFKNCTEINGLNNLDTSIMEDFSMTFANCESLEYIDLSSFDTSNVIGFSHTFDNCHNLKQIDVSNFDTSKVVYFEQTFRECRQLSSIDVSNFDTSNAKSLFGLFDGCLSLKEIDLTSFDTHNVKTFDMLFSGCQNLEEIDLSNFDFSSAKGRLFSMFESCSKLKEIDLSNFYTENIENYINMFKDCSNLKELDLSSFDTTNLKYCDGMFSGCASLEKIIVGDKWVENNHIKNDKDMFLNCVNLVGQSGTKYDENNVDSTYFCIDEGEERPGYLTLKVNEEIQEDNPSINEDITNSTETQQYSSLSLPIIVTVIALAIAAIVFALFNSKKK